MGRVSKLLNKPLKAYTIYSLIVLVCSIPFYYLVVDYIWLNELDEHNHIIKKRVETRFKDVKLNETELADILSIWNVLQPGTKLAVADNRTNFKDSIYTVVRKSDYSEKPVIDRFRGLSSVIIIAGKPYHLTVETNVEEVEETLLAIALVTFIFFSLLVIGFIILNKRIAKIIWQPFQHTFDRLGEFDLLKHKTINFEDSNIEEFQKLNKEITHLIEKNVSVFDQQKTFIENASHELQTPLAILKSKIELFLQNGELTKKQLDIINTIHIPLGRISRINKNLLLLAKIENNQFSETDHIDLPNLIKENLELLSDYISAKKIKIHVEIQSEEKIICNRTLIEILVNNLLINAIIHNIVSGEITIKYADDLLTLSNSGLTKLDTQSVFKRFVIANTENTNSGLGLSIVKEICNRYHWLIEYDFENLLHSFFIRFKK
ncbi:MAG: HAMP domain-containing histidine kinase [Oligoflexus sp.]|nr:HAMP domain-containing histidine kinase [Pseudopedobacter sp.]